MILANGLKAEVRGSDIVLTDPETGKFALVRPVKGRGDLAASVKHEKDYGTAACFETTGVSLQSVVMLMAFEKGASVPPVSFRPPRLEATLQAMAAVVDREKATARREKERQLAAAREKLKGFDPVALGKPMAVTLEELQPVPRVEGIVGKALRFEGGKGVTLTPAPPFENRAPFTLAFWVNITKASGNIYANNGNRGLSMAIFQGRGWKVSANGNWYWGGGSIDRARSKWCHVAYTFDGTTLRFYENGGLRKEEAVGRIEGPGKARLGDGFTGLIDDLRVYGRSIADEDVKKLYLYQKHGFGRK
jgi:hypothetical protein